MGLKRTVHARYVGVINLLFKSRNVTLLLLQRNSAMCNWLNKLPWDMELN